MGHSRGRVREEKAEEAIMLVFSSSSTFGTPE